MATSPSPSLQVTCLLNQQAVGYRLYRRPRPVTIGSAKRVTFVTPQLMGFPRRFRLLTPVRDGVRLHLGPGMRGVVKLRGTERAHQRDPDRPRAAPLPARFRHVPSGGALSR